MAISRADTSIGIRQTWQDITASVAIDTNYTNTTGRAIQVSIKFFAVATDWACSINVGAIQVAHFEDKGVNSNYVTLQAIIPPGETYIASGTGATVNKWWELK